MIVYQLACRAGHFFEGWFASAEACDRQTAAGQLQCPACSTGEVHKLPSAPYVQTSVAASAKAPVAQEGARCEALLALRKAILANTENVGRQFAEIARRIHYQEEKARGIRGQVTAEEALELREEGVATYTIPAEILPNEEVH
ncbi:MAG TPA: DUF1178 family protein [Usitatibacter sp.]|nr:DUF1178 family protein [Usitatibacter sp.]